MHEEDQIAKRWNGWTSSSPHGSRLQKTVLDISDYHGSHAGPDHVPGSLTIPLAADALYARGILISPVGAVLMSLSTVTVAVNARFLKLAK
jgi:hypothetical protein